jgi:putative transposase
MRYPASEKLEIIHLVERSHLPIKQTLDKLGIPRTTFYRWYDRYQIGGLEALEDQSPRPSRVWNRIPDDVRQGIVDLALDVPELSPRELAVRFTDTENYFVSEASVYRLLKSLDLITSPAFIVIKAANEFKDKTTAINQLWQTDFTYLKVIGWGWMYLSTILDDYSRYIIAWKLCTTMQASDVTETLELALQASGCDQAHVAHKPRLLSDNGSSYVSGELAEWLGDKKMGHVRGARQRGTVSSANAGQDRALAPDPEKPHPAGELLFSSRPGGANRGVCRSLQPSTLSREHQQSHARRRLLRARPGHFKTARKDQTQNDGDTAIAIPQTRRLIS